jgi:dienelactone hydrolase
MAIVTRAFPYYVGGTRCDGALVVDDAQTGPRPAVAVFHGWEGRSDAQVDVARALAQRGYVGIACDVFGDGIRGDLAADNSALIAPWLRDRAALRARLLGTAAAVRRRPEVDATKVAAIGFCFGGLCVLDLARAGADVQAVASFHGLFGRPEGLPTAPIRARVVAFHGWDDPMVPPADVVALGQELTAAGADWQLVAYGGTMHAFMAVGANRPEAGIRYNARSARRAWAALELFLAEAFAE